MPDAKNAYSPVCCCCGTQHHYSQPVLPWQSQCCNVGRQAAAAANDNNMCVMASWRRLSARALIRFWPSPAWRGSNSGFITFAGVLFLFFTTRLVGGNSFIYLCRSLHCLPLIRICHSQKKIMLRPRENPNFWHFTSVLKNDGNNKII